MLLGISSPVGVSTRARRRRRAVHHVVEDDVVAPLVAGEILLGVVDDVIGAERSDQFHVPRTAHAGDLRAGRPGDLHRKGPDAARRTVDQHPGPRSDPAHMAHGDQRDQARPDRCGGLLERRARGFLVTWDAGTTVSCARVPTRGASSLSQSDPNTSSPTRRSVTFTPTASTHPGNIASPHRCRRPAEPGPQAEDVRDTSHGDPVRGVHAGGTHPDQHVLVANRRSVHLVECEHAPRRPVPLLDDGLHRLLLRRCRCRGRYPSLSPMWFVRPTARVCSRCSRTLRIQRRAAHTRQAG